MSPVDRQGGEARNHEADEVEAVAEAIWNGLNPQGWVEPQSYHRAAAERSIAALDAVRCAQGRDTDAPERSDGDWRRKKPLRVASEDQPAALAMWDAWDRYHRAVLAARSPQGEGHEAGIEAAAHVHYSEPYIDGDPNRPRTDRQMAERMIAAYLSRCPSPEQLGELLDGKTT